MIVLKDFIRRLKVRYMIESAYSSQYTHEQIMLITFFFDVRQNWYKLTVFNSKSEKEKHPMKNTNMPETRRTCDRHLEYLYFSVSSTIYRRLHLSEPPKTTMIGNFVFFKDRKIQLGIKKSNINKRKHNKRRT